MAELDTSFMLAALAIMGVITFVLRALPLLMRRSLLDAPWMSRLNRDLPLCVMVILVLHALGGSGPLLPGLLLAQLAALAAVALSYLRWRSALLSVGVGLLVLALLAPR